jgi:hypothetical protein
VNWLRAQWQLNGTKLLGYGGAIISMLTLIDHETIDMIGQTFGPVYGPRVTHALALAGSLATAYRGYENSKRPP